MWRTGKWEEDSSFQHIPTHNLAQDFSLAWLTLTEFRLKFIDFERIEVNKILSENPEWWKRLKVLFSIFLLLTWFWGNGKGPKALLERSSRRLFFCPSPGSSRRQELSRDFIEAKWWIFYLLSSGDVPTAALLRDHCRNRTPKYKT